MIDHSAMHLGKKPVRHDKRTLRLAKYLVTPNLPPTPPSYAWSPKIASWPMYLNNSLGDCTCAAAGHMEELWTAALGKEFSPADDDVLLMYEAVSGYRPGDEATDTGAVELDVLNYWRQTGLAGRKISAYVQVDVSNFDHVKTAIYLFGGVYIGIQLPLTAQSQDVWDVIGEASAPDAQPGSWGGHAVPAFDFDVSDDTTVVTWGLTKKMTKAFWDAYVDEAYAIVSPDFLSATGVDPNGIALADLSSDLQAVAS